MLTESPTMAQHAAMRRFPYSRTNIRGDGLFALVSKCFRGRWKIFLYHTAEDRNTKLNEWNTGCPAGIDCKLGHEAVDLHLR